MYKIVGIKFKSSNRMYYFDINNFQLKKNDSVIVETDKGMQYGIVVTDIKEVGDKDLGFPLKKVLRVATERDHKQNNDNLKKGEAALLDAKKCAKDLKLKMNFTGAYFTFDRNQLICNFVADQRIDFRELAKKLASIYKTRIELRQIGVRDKAKEVGGLGPCGRFLCCNAFLTDFNSVSINMAKNQYIALNPTKINGICGRLLCCLNYEDKQYTEMKKEFPPIGKKIETKDVTGKVTSHNLFKRTFTVKTKDMNYLEIDIDDL